MVLIRMDKKTALLIIDAISHFDFPGGEQLGRRARPVVQSILRLRRRFDQNAQPVVYVNDNWTQWQGGFDELLCACTEAGGHAGFIATSLAPHAHHYHVLKPKNSGFFNCALPALLGQLDCEALVITGFATDSCVMSTALDAHMRDYPLWVPSDCTTAITQERKTHALSLLRANTGATTLASSRVRGLFPA